MMRIAVYQRHAGATREENQSALEEWYARQPEELLGSTPEEVQRDISGILDWVYSDRFTAARRMVRDSTTVSESQMDIVLNQWSRSSRRIVFLLLVRTRLGQPRISAADIGKATGISVRTVYDVIHKLVDSEVIIRTNVFIYLLEDGSIITLPVHLIRIANVMIGGEPVLEFNCKSVRDDMRQQGTKAQKSFLEDEDLKVRLEGFPPEVSDALNKGADWVQLNPENTFVLQDVKEDWARYAVPMVATCLSAFRRKALIAQYESALLNLGAHSFVHVTYGDAKSDIMPDITALNAVNALFRRAMTGSALATTNHLCKATVIQPDTKEMFDDDKYRDVNAEILSAGGISGIIVSGRAEDGSNFASAQVSMQTAAIRIKQARDNFCE